VTTPESKAQVLSPDEFFAETAETTPLAEKRVLSPDEFFAPQEIEKTLSARGSDPTLEIAPEHNLEVKFHDFLSAPVSTIGSLVGTPIAQSPFGKGMVEAFQQGNDDSNLDIASFSAMMSGGAKYFDEHIVPIEAAFNERKANNPVKGSNFLSDAMYQISGMLPAIGKGLAEGKTTGAAMAVAAAALPGGQAVIPEAFVFGDVAGSMTYWMKQGAGSMYRDLRKEQVPDDIARPSALIAGSIYGAIEFSQVDKFSPGTAAFARSLIKKKVMTQVQKMALRYGADWAKEVGEEGLQEIVTSVANDIALNIAEKTNLTVGQIAGKALTSGGNAVVQSALPMLLMLGPSAGVNIARTAKAQAEFDARVALRKELAATQNSFNSELEKRAEEAVVKATEYAGGRTLSPDEVKAVVEDTKSKMLSEAAAKAEAGKAAYAKRGEEKKAKLSAKEQAKAKKAAETAKAKEEKAAETAKAKEEKAAKEAQTKAAFTGGEATPLEKINRDLIDAQQALKDLIQEEADTLKDMFSSVEGGQIIQIPKGDGQGGGVEYRRTRLPDEAKHPVTGAKPRSDKQWRELAIHNLERNRSATDQTEEYFALLQTIKTLQEQGAKAALAQGAPLKVGDVLKATGQIDVSKAHTLTERVLLQLKLRAEARGAKAGFSAGYDEARTDVMAKLEAGQDARKSIIDYMKLMLPKAEWGQFTHAVNNAKDEGDVGVAFLKIEERAEKVYRDAVVAEAESMAEKIENSPSITINFKKMAKGIMDRYYAYLKANPQGYTASQLDGMARKLRIIDALGRTDFKNWEAQREAEQDLRKTEVLSTAQPLVHEKEVGARKPLTEQSISEKARSKIREMINGIIKRQVGLTPIDAFAIMTGMEDMKSVLDHHFGEYLAFNDAVFKERDALMRKYNFTRVQLEEIGVYAAREQKGGYEKLANLGISEEQADDIDLSPEQKEFYDFVRKTFDSVHPAVKEYMARVYNRDVGDVLNYVSFISDPERQMDAFGIQDRFGNGLDEKAFLDREIKHRTKTVEAKSTKERTGAGGQKIMLNIDQIFSRHMDNVAYLLNMGEPIKNYFEIVNSPEVKKQLGGIASQAWLDWLDLLARKGGAEGTKFTRDIDKLRRNLGRSMLPARLSSALIQFSSLPATVSVIGEHWTLHGVAQTVANKDARAFVLQNFPEVAKEIGGDPAFEEIRSREGRNSKTALEKMTSTDWWTEVGMLPLKRLDGMMRMITALGAYGRAVTEAGGTIDYTNVDKAAVKKATKIMRETQGSSFFIHQPLALTQNGYLFGSRALSKAALQFQSFNLFGFSNAVKQIYGEGLKKGDALHAARAAFWLLGVKVAMEIAIRSGSRTVLDALFRREPKEQKPYWYQFLITEMGNIPFIGNLFNAIEYGSDPVPLIAASQKVIDSGISRAYRGVEMGTKMKGVATATIAGAGLFAGLPGAMTILDIANSIIDSVDSGGFGDGDAL